MSDFDTAPDPAHAFEQSKGENLPGGLESVNETARAELDNRYNHERAHRNMVRDYDEALAVSRMKAVQIDQRFETRRETIRNTGQTLSGAFDSPSQKPHERASPYVEVHTPDQSRGRRR